MADTTDPRPPGRGKLVALTVLVTTLFWTVIWGGFALARGRPQPTAFAVQPPPATATPAPTPTPVPVAEDTPTVVVSTPTSTATTTTRAGVVALDTPDTVLPTGEAPATAASPITSTLPAPDAGLLININTANAVELETLPGIGPKTAEAIIAHRTEHGPFATIDALTDVKGIGPATLEKLRALITTD